MPQFDNALPNSDFARNAAANVEILKCQSEIIFREILKDLSDEHVKDSLGLNMTVSADKLSASISSPLGEGRIKFAPRITTTGLQGTWSVQKRDVNGMDETCWRETWSFSTTLNGMLTGAGCDEGINLNKVYRREIFELTLRIATALGV